MEFDEKVLRKSLCARFGSHKEIVQAAYMCQNCYALGNDLKAMQMCGCPMTRCQASSETAATPLAATGASSAARKVPPCMPPALPAPTSPSTSKSTEKFEEKKGSGKPADELKAPPLVEPKQVAGPRRDPAVDAEILAAKAELDKLLVLQALQAERARLEDLILQKRQYQEAKPFGSRSLASIIWAGVAMHLADAVSN